MNKKALITGITLRVDGGLILSGMPEGFAGQWAWPRAAGAVRRRSEP